MPADDPLLAALRRGLLAAPPTIEPRWFYDDLGSTLFDAITLLDEYYPTRAERAILVEHADAIACACRAETLAELGAGSATKTEVLLAALVRAGTLRVYAPLYASEGTLTRTTRRIADTYPIDVAPTAADLLDVDRLPRAGRRTIAFLGGTLGNLTPPVRAAFFERVRAASGPDDCFLLGLDLVKDPRRLTAAYDDAVGVTAAFNRNMLASINRAVGADFDPAWFGHRAVWNDEHEWIEMRLESTRAQTVRIPRLDLTLEFSRGDHLLTEISAKFRRERITSELAAANLAVDHWWTDPDGDFALLFATPTGR